MKQRKGIRYGARVERELMHKLAEKGFFVIRAAGSGHMKSPDVMAFKLGRCLAFEVKGSGKDELRFQREQLENLERWQKGTGLEIYIAWKVPRRGFLFLPLMYLKKRSKTVVIKREEAEALSFSWEEL